jgi:hypothetical protein
VTPLDADTVEITGASLADVGRVAAAHGVELHGLSTITDSERLEAAFLELTEHRIEATP